MSDGEWALICVTYAVVDFAVAGLSIWWATWYQDRLNRRAEQQLQTRAAGQARRT